jgi:hypothetical protein
MISSQELFREVSMLNTGNMTIVSAAAANGATAAAAAAMLSIVHCLDN